MTARAIRSLTEDDLRRTFDPGSLTRGKQYARAGRVTVVDLEDDGALRRG